MQQLHRHGILFCLVGPAGSGKTTLGSHLLENVPGITRSISMTTRPKRPEEVPGECYYFITSEEFQQKVAKGEFFEHEEIHGNHYGTPRDPLASAIRTGNDILLIIDIRGALNFKKYFPNDTIIIFVSPPSSNLLKTRLEGRGEISSADVARRLETARFEYDQFMAVSATGSIDYLIVNDNLPNACKEVAEVVHTERKRVKRFRDDDLKKLCL